MFLKMGGLITSGDSSPIEELEQYRYLIEYDKNKR